MKIGELLRQLADVADAQEAPAEQQPAIQSVNAPEQYINSNQMPDVLAVNAEELTTADNTDNTDPIMMVAPLQQSHELLKKVAHVDNHTSVFADDEMDTDRLKQLADIKPKTDAVTVTVEVK